MLRSLDSFTYNICAPSESVVQIQTEVTAAAEMGMQIKQHDARVLKLHFLRASSSRPTHHSSDEVYLLKQVLTDLCSD